MKYLDLTGLQKLWTKIKTHVQTSLEGYAKKTDLFSKNYNDLTNKPTIPSIDGLAKTADLAKVATSGSYNDLSNKPTIPSLDGYAKTSDIPSIDGLATEEYVDEKVSSMTAPKYSEGLAYTLSGDGNSYILSYRGTCTDTDIVIPSTYNEKPVIAIRNNVFTGDSIISTVVIPDSVTTIGDYAFYNCPNLTSVTIGNSVTSIGKAAFRQCSSLIDIVIPNSVTSIGEYAFAGCSSLTSIVIPNSVTYIGDSAFSSSKRLIIYCEATEQPSGWHSTWMTLPIPAVWGVVTDILGLNYKLRNNFLTKDELPIFDLGNQENHKDAQQTMISTLQRAEAGCYLFKYWCSCSGNACLAVVYKSEGSIEGTVYSSDRKFRQFQYGIESGEFNIDGCWLPLASFDEEREDLKTENKTIIVAINELNTKVSNIPSKFNYRHYGTGNATTYGIISPVMTSDTNFIIPSTDEGTPVDSICSGAFSGCTNAKSVFIPDSIITVGANAFVNCPNLKIYCEAESQPSGWNSNWNPDNLPVFWNSAIDTFGVNEKGFATEEYVDSKVGSSGGGSPMTSVTYAELKALRDNGELIEGMFYRITDYVCTTVQADTRATDHRLDIIVQALSNNKLSEMAKADFNSEDSYFEDNNANLSAWEIKYCLDNDTTRFAWALDGQAITNLESMYSGDTLPTRQPSFDGREQGASDNGYYYAWGTQSDVDDEDPNDFIYSKNETITNGEIVYSACDGEEQIAYVIEGKGVIYYMKDEHGNECPYDFKNIQFKRYVTTINGYPELDLQSIEEGGTYPTWVYTFCGNSYHIDNDEWSELKDGSLESPYMHQSDEYTYAFCNNSMKPYYMIYDSENEDTANCGKQYLNNNVFFGYWEEIGSTDPENYPFYYAYACAFIELGYNCQNNTFGTGCRSITMGNDCSDNIVGQWCVNIKFGYQCAWNKIYAQETTLCGMNYDNVLYGGYLTLLEQVSTIKHNPDESAYQTIYKGNYTIV